MIPAKPCIDMGPHTLQAHHSSLGHLWLLMTSSSYRRTRGWYCGPEAKGFA